MASAEFLAQVLGTAAGVAIAVVPAFRRAVRVEARRAAYELLAELPCRKQHGARPPAPTPGVNGGPSCSSS